MSIDIKIKTDNTDEAIARMNTAIQKSLKMIGLVAQEYAADNSPVDTGRLRASMTHQLEDNSVYIGTNVEYAIYQELGTRYIKGHHMLENTAKAGLYALFLIADKVLI